MLNFRRWLRCFHPVIYGFPFLRPPSTAFCFVPAFVQPSLCLVSLSPHRQRALSFLGTPPRAGVTWKRAAPRWVTFLKPLPPGWELGHHAGVPGAAPAARTPPALSPWWHWGGSGIVWGASCGPGISFGVTAGGAWGWMPFLPSTSRPHPRPSPQP